MKKYSDCIYRFYFIVKKQKKERSPMTEEFKLSIYKSSLNEDEKNYLANIADQYTADGRSMPCDHDERLAKLKIQKRVSKMRVLRTMNTDLILSICESALSDPEKEYLIAVAE